jgi:site-specific DNA-methyltransferase (adenine-specific)
MKAKSEVFNIDCIEGMKQYPDNYFELAIVDPPYGIDAANDARADTKYGKSAAKSKKYGAKNWDKNTPNLDYYNQLFRVSKNQIIWGANHLGNFDSSSCWIVWDKENGDNGYADAELAYTSFKSAVRIVKIKWHGMIQHDMKNKENRIHPTQKPVKLYKWLLTNYSKEGDKILDTHLGSGSSRIAAYDLGFEFTGFELDEDYFKSSEKRFKQHTDQLTLF